MRTDVHRSETIIERMTAKNLSNNRLTYRDITT